MDSLTSPTSAILFGAMAVLAAVSHVSKKRKQNQIIAGVQIESSGAADIGQPLLTADGPMPLPLIGNLHQLAKYQENPFEGFCEMAKQYGPIYKLHLGSTKAYVVNEYEHMKEVLIKKGNHFDSRPDFQRWNTYFGGDRQKSLALCDWSDLQKTRRNIVRSFLIFRQESAKFDQFDYFLNSEVSTLLNEIDSKIGTPIMVKKDISYCAMNVFMSYMCSERFSVHDPDFQKITKQFDLIFEDINNGHPTDFLPWLSPLFKKYQQDINSTAHSIRTFILEKIIKDRPENFDSSNINDLLDALLANYQKKDGKLSLDWQNILFALEDILGGSSAISNTVMRALVLIVQNPDVYAKIQNEIDENIGRNKLPTLLDRSSMKYSEAAILEVLRHTSSPLVPHVATRDSSVGDIFIESGSVILFNNYELNTSPKLWNEPERFQPERFIEKGQIKKPAHFMPFSTGKRACVGSKILVNVTFITLISLLQKYNVSIPENENPILPIGKIALIGDGFNLIFNHRD